MIIGNKTFESGKEPYVMGILNVTPDSFSDGGQHNTMDTALFTTEKMIAEVCRYRASWLRLKACQHNRHQNRMPFQEPPCILQLS